MGASCSPQNRGKPVYDSDEDIHDFDDDLDTSDASARAPFFDENGKIECPYYREPGKGGKCRWDPPVTEETDLLSEDEYRLVVDPMMRLVGRDKLVSGLSDDCLVRCVRGYVNNEPKLKEWKAAVGREGAHIASSAEGAERVIEWREAHGTDRIMDQRLDGSEEFHGLWPGAICGNDVHGHVVYCERFCEMKSKELLGKFTMDEILQHRAQVHEAIQRRQLEISCERGEVLYKHIQVMDVGGMDMFQFSSLKSVLLPIFKFAEEQYPNTLWKLFVCNAPSIFRAIWTIVKPLLDPETAAKVNICGGPSNAKAAMVAAGIPEEALPKWVGGTFAHSGAAYDLIERIVGEHESGQCNGVKAEAKARMAPGLSAEVTESLDRFVRSGSTLRSYSRSRSRSGSRSRDDDPDASGKGAGVGGGGGVQPLKLPLLAWIPVAAAVLVWCWMQESKGAGGLLSDIHAHYPLRASLLGH